MAKLKQICEALSECPVGVKSDNVQDRCFQGDPCCDCPFFNMWPGVKS